MQRRSVAVVTALLAVAASATFFLTRSRFASADLHHLVFFAARRCSTASSGCALGSRLGGLAAASRALEALRETGAVTVLWAGRTFTCASEDPFALAEAAVGENVAAVGVSVADATLPTAMLSRLVATTRARWVLTNGERREGPEAWSSFVDVPIAGGQTARVFAVAASRSPVTASTVVLADPVEAIEAAVRKSPAGRLNVVLVSTDSRAVLDRIAAVPNVHVVFDGDEAAPEPYTADETPSGALQAGVRGEGHGLFRLSFRPHGAFERWVYGREPAKSLPAKNEFNARWTYMSAVELLTP